MFVCPVATEERDRHFKTPWLTKRLGTKSRAAGHHRLQLQRQMARVRCCSALKCSFKDAEQRAPCVSSKSNADKLHMQVMAVPEWKEGLDGEGEGHRADICYCGEWLLCYLKRLPLRSHVTCQKWLMSNNLGTFTVHLSTCRVILYRASLPLCRDQL